MENSYPITKKKANTIPKVIPKIIDSEIAIYRGKLFRSTCILEIICFLSK